MNRNVFLDGELGHRFGTEHTMNANSISEVFKCLEANYDGVRQYVISCVDNGVDFSIKVGNNEISSDEEVFLSFGPGDIYISPQPAGSKGGGKLLAAVAVVAAVAFTGGALLGAGGTTAAAGGTTAAGGAAGGLGAGEALVAAEAAKGLTLKGALTNLGTGLLTNIALAGIQKLLAPDPSVDKDDDESYLFQGSAQTAEEGNPVPILYGELRVPGRPVSFHVRSTNRSFYNDGGITDNRQNPPGTEPPPNFEDEDSDPGYNPGDDDGDGGGGDYRPDPAPEVPDDLK